MPYEMASRAAGCRPRRAWRPAIRGLRRLLGGGEAVLRTGLQTAAYHFLPARGQGLDAALPVAGDGLSARVTRGAPEPNSRMGRAWFRPGGGAGRCAPGCGRSACGGTARRAHRDRMPRLRGMAEEQLRRHVVEGAAAAGTHHVISAGLVEPRQAEIGDDRTQAAVRSWRG